LTTRDNISACCLTNREFEARHAKKFLNILLLEFRSFFEFNPSLYSDVSEDIEEWDTSLEFPKLDELFSEWQNPFQAD